jgi:hemolysin-activating ACP:hemolysin acyltransferase
MAILVTQMNKSEVALAAAVHFLARRAPFDRYPFGTMTLSLDAQVKQKTYLFALEETKVVGYLGWIMLDAARAEAFARENRTPRYDETGGDDVAWLLVVAATDRKALMAMLDAARSRYPGKRIMGVRHKPGGKKIVFDSFNRRRPRDSR